MIRCCLVGVVLCVQACAAPPSAYTCSTQAQCDRGQCRGGVCTDSGEGEGEATAVVVDADLVIPYFWQPADGVSTTTVRLHVRTDSGGDASGITLTATSDLADFAVVEGRTDAQGFAAFTFTSNVAGRFNVDITTAVDSSVHLSRAIEFLPCLSLEDTYMTSLYPEVFVSCVACHNEFGYAAQQGAALRLPFAGAPDFAAQSVSALRDYQRNVDSAAAAAGSDALQLGIDAADPTVVPRIVRNAALGHTAAAIVDPLAEPATLRRLASFVSRLSDDDSCGAGTDTREFSIPISERSTPLGDNATYAKAAKLLGRVVDADAAIVIVDDATLQQQLEALVASTQAERFLLDTWNGWLNNLGSLAPIVALPESRYRKFYFGSKPPTPQTPTGAACNPALPPSITGDGFACCHADETQQADPVKREALCAQKALLATAALREEPARVLLDLYRRDRPLSEAMTADFNVVNAELAELYGLLQSDHRTLKPPNVGVFSDSIVDDAVEFRSVIVAAAPLVNNATSIAPRGLLTLPGVISRYVTTASNKQRGRAATLILEKFLDVPVRRLAPLAVPNQLPADDVEAQIRQQPCVVCHAQMDPIAVGMTAIATGKARLDLRPRCMSNMPVGGLGYDDAGRVRKFLPGEDPNAADPPCPPSNPPAQFFGEPDPDAPQRFAALIDALAVHPRVDVALVVPLVLAVLQQQRLYPPDRQDPDADAKRVAFVDQEVAIEGAVAAYRASGKNLRAVFVELLRSPQFRNSGIATGTNDARAMEILGYGGRLLTPETLNQKIEFVTGGIAFTDRRITPYRQISPGVRGLLVPDTFGVLLGGVDGRNVLQRSQDVLPIRTNIMRRIGYEVGCVLVPHEFSHRAQDRALMSAVELDTQPSADNAPRIKQQIATLHARFFGEQATDDDLDEAYALFSEVVGLNAAQLLPASCDNNDACPADHFCAAGKCRWACSMEFDYFQPYVLLGGPYAFIDACSDTSPPQQCEVATDCPRNRCADGRCECNDPSRSRILNDVDHTARAWVAVVALMIADPRFMLE